MIFLSLWLDLMLFLFGNAALTGSAALGGAINGPEHTTHGHLPGPPDGHNGSTHEHHGQHGHTAAPDSGGNHFH